MAAMATGHIRTISPVDGSTCFEGERATPAALDALIAGAARAQASWRQTSVEDRLAILGRLVDAVVAKKDALALELTMQMGRPLIHTPGEVTGFETRARAMLALAPDALAPIVPSVQSGFDRYITREALGVVLVLAPWNYPWLTAVNAVIPALAAGNAVILKHSEQTPLVAERFVEAGRAAGLHDDLFSFVHTNHSEIARAVGHPQIAFVAFTGSVEGGHAIQKAAAARFIATGLELGGKDPGYVCEDADVEAAVAGLIDGAFYNAGQSCCGIERIYVHARHHEEFVERAIALTASYVLGDPRHSETTLGPVVRKSSAAHVQRQVDTAVAAGARALLDPSSFGDHVLPYLPPQILVDVNHEMELMREETFGPAVGIMKVADDDEALRLMNDSRYGLTASIWTRDVERAKRIGRALETGTVFMNRCDYLDPELAWVGVKDSGRGATLSVVGYEQLTRPKSFHLKLA